MAMTMTAALAACGNKSDSKDETKKAEVTTQSTTEATTEETTVEVTTEETSEVVTEESSEVETETKKRRGADDDKSDETESVTESKVAPQMEATLENASGYVGKTLDELVSAVGDYNNFETAGACFEDENELNGIATYDNFTVYCHSEEGQTKWVIDAVE